MKEIKLWPKNLTAKKIREEMKKLDGEINYAQNEYEELTQELIRRKSKQNHG